MRFDGMNGLNMKRALSPVSVADTTVQVTEILDTADCKSITLAILTGSIADADATFGVVLYEDDAAGMGTETAVADADLVGTEALASFEFDDDNKVFKLGYVGTKRYIRAKITPVANASAALLAAVWLTEPTRAGAAANPPA